MFSSSRQPLLLIKRNTDVIYSSLRRFLSTSFDRKGIFETLWLSVNYLSKLDEAKLRKVLGYTGFDDEDPERKLTDAERMMKQSIDMRNQYRTTFGEEPAKVTKYATRGDQGFNINLTASGLTQQLKQTDYPKDSAAN